MLNDNIRCVPLSPVKTSVRHDEVSSLSINPVIELRERRRDVHTEEVLGLCCFYLSTLHAPSLPGFYIKFVSQLSFNAHQLK